MARPQSPDYDKRRDRILEVAARLYAQHGFRGASVADLASACGASKSLIYHYFPSKHEMLYAVMASHLDALVEAAENVAGEEAPEKRLRALTLAFMELYVGARHNHKVLLNELDNLPPGPRSEVVSKQRGIIRVVETLVKEIRPDADPIALPVSMLFFGMINWTHTWFRPDGATDARAFADLAVDLMLGGLGSVQAS